MATLYKHSLAFDQDWNNPNWEQRQEEQITAYREQFRAKKPGALVGGVVRFPWADGYAQYMVVSERPLVLAHMEIGDAWAVPYSQIRGIRQVDVQAMVESEERLRSLFARHNAGSN